jgi:hypothetical protein
MYRKLVCTIVGYEQDGRILELIETLRNCRKAGLAPRVFLSNPPAGKEQSRINQKKARDWAMSQDADLLFLEDDLIFNDKLFHYFLNRTMQEHKDDVVFFYAHDTSSDSHLFYDNKTIELIKNPNKKIPPFFYKFPNYERLHFGQAVYIPLRVLKLMTGVLRDYVRSGSGELMPTDSLVSLTLSNRRYGWIGLIDAYVTLPHPVQHRHVRIGREGENEGRDAGRKRSLSFGRG